MRIVRVCVCVWMTENACVSAHVRASLSHSLSRLRLRVCMCCEHFDRMFAECLNIIPIQPVKEKKSGVEHTQKDLP